MKRETDLKCRSKGRPGLAVFVARVRNVAAISGRYSMELWLFLLSSINSCFPEHWEKPLGKPSSSSVYFFGPLLQPSWLIICQWFMSKIIKKRQTNKQEIPMTSKGIDIKSFEQVKGPLICKSDNTSLTFFYCLCILVNILTLQNQSLKLHASCRKININVIPSNWNTKRKVIICVILNVGKKKKGYNHEKQHKSSTI